MTKKIKPDRIEEYLEKADLLLANHLDRELKSFLIQLNFHNIAQIINRLPRGKRKTFAILPPELQAEVALILNDHSRELIFPRLTNRTIARFLHFNDEDDAVDILQFLPANRHQYILKSISDEKRKKIEQLNKFGPETAGGLMDLNFIIVKPDFTMKDLASKVQDHTARSGNAPLVLAEKKDGKTLGYIPYRKLILSRPSSSVASLVNPLPKIPYSADQEQVLKFAQGTKTDVIGVVDEEDQILGIIHVRDLLHIAHSEATEDVYRFAGLREDEDVYDSIQMKVRRRYSWLIINLGTAFLAAAVVSLFQTSIEELSLLAVYMPIVAGEGGNAATQSLAVVVRGLALGDIPWREAREIVMKEALAGIVNGAIIGAVSSLIALLLQAPWMLGLVLGAALIINLLVAGLFGATVPLVLKKFNIDPAVASSIFVTTATDVFGFLSFLGLGTWILLR